MRNGEGDWMGDTIVYSSQQDLYKTENIQGGFMVKYQTGRYSAIFRPRVLYQVWQ